MSHSVRSMLQLGRTSRERTNKQTIITTITTTTIIIITIIIIITTIITIITVIIIIIIIVIIVIGGRFLRWFLPRNNWAIRVPVRPYYSAHAPSGVAWLHCGKIAGIRPSARRWRLQAFRVRGWEKFRYGLVNNWVFSRNNICCCLKTNCTY